MKEWLIGLTALVLIAVAYIHIPMEWRRQKDIEMGNKIIANIEQFQQKTGVCLPTRKQNYYRLVFITINKVGSRILFPLVTINMKSVFKMVTRRRF